MALELDWLAFCYIAGELTADEALAFEGRLADDQAAREAVARAVELSEAIARAERGRGVLTMKRPLRRAWVGAAVAAAACLVVALVWSSRSSNAPTARPAAEPLAGRAAPPNDAVALAWSGLHSAGETESLASSDLVAWLDEAPAGSDGEAGAFAAGLAADELAPPRWLLEGAALRGAAVGPAERGEN